jgi:putative flippase GtrA
MSKLKELLVRYKEVILYVIFGGLTTLINIVVYWICRNLITLQVVPSDIIAWILSVIFAYVTNKIWVFESRSTKAAVLIREIGEFFAARLFSLGFDVLFLYVTVEKLSWPDLPMKIVANVIVIIMNYLFSKLLIFRKNKEEGK